MMLWEIGYEIEIAIRQAGELLLAVELPPHPHPLFFQMPDISITRMA